MHSVRLLNFGVEYPQLEKDPSIFRSGKKRFGEFKNKISISMLSSIPVLELEKNLVKELKKSRKYFGDIGTRRKNFSEVEHVQRRQSGEWQVPASKRNELSYFNENLKDVFPKGRYASVGRDLRMGNYAMNMLK